MKTREKTVEIEIRLNLPGSVAREAESTGLLQPTSLESLLREELQRRRVDRLFDAADHLVAVALPPLTEAEVEAEITAARQSRRTAHAGRR